MAKKSANKKAEAEVSPQAPAVAPLEERIENALQGSPVCGVPGVDHQKAVQDGWNQCADAVRMAMSN